MAIGILFWLVLCGVIAYGAEQRGRSGIGWFFISALLSPIIGVIILVCLPKVEASRDEVTDMDNEELKRFIKWREAKKALDKKTGK